jgi:peptide/nickel transport system substrate-binding protein
VPDDPDTLAPYWLTSAYADEVVYRVYGDGLVRIGFDYKPEPAVAEKWTVSPDGTTYTFNIRKGIKFHDGQPLTAKDVEFSYNILLSDDYQGPNKSDVKEIASVKAVDDSTFEIKLKQAFAPFLFGGASEYIVPKHIFEKVAIKDMASSDLWLSPWVPAPTSSLNGSPASTACSSGTPSTGSRARPASTRAPWVRSSTRSAFA